MPTEAIGNITASMLVLVLLLLIIYNGKCLVLSQGQYLKAKNKNLCLYVFAMI